MAFHCKCRKSIRTKMPLAIMPKTALVSLHQKSKVTYREAEMRKHFWRKKSVITQLKFKKKINFTETSRQAPK